MRKWPSGRAPSQRFMRSRACRASMPGSRRAKAGGDRRCVASPQLDRSSYAPVSSPSPPRPKPVSVAASGSCLEIFKPWTSPAVAWPFGPLNGLRMFSRQGSSLGHSRSWLWPRPSWKPHRFHHVSLLRVCQEVLLFNLPLFGTPSIELC